jgi:hypothetical protein
MAYYLRWSPSTGNANNNKELVQISGVVGSLATLSFKVAENMPAYSTFRYIFDARRLVNSLSNGGDARYVYQSTPGIVSFLGVSNPKINGVSRPDFTGFLTLVTDDVAEFAVGGTVSGGCFSFGARFNETESCYGFAVKEIVVVDAAGSHTINMSSSNGNLNQFTSTDGALTVRLFNFPANNKCKFNCKNRSCFC